MSKAKSVNTVNTVKRIAVVNITRKLEPKMPDTVTELNIQDLLKNLDFNNSSPWAQGSNLTLESLKALGPFIRYYQFLGVIPISMLPEYTGLATRTPNPYIAFSVVSLLIQITMLCKGLLELILSFVDKTDKVGTINGLIYFSHVLSMSTIMIKNTKRLPKLMEAFLKAEVLCAKYCSKGDGLVKHCWILFGYFLLTQLFGNVLYYYSECKTFH
jgi:uncharacterized membrane protein HdeD (DUF308 family)